MALRKGRIFLVVLLLLVVALVVVGQLGQRVPQKTVLRITLDQQVEEEDWPDFQGRLWEGEVIVFRHVLEALERAKTDGRIVGVSVEVASPRMGLAKIQELRRKLAELSQAGKFCAAYLDSDMVDNRTYYLASACPEVYIAPTGSLLLTSLMGHSIFVRGTLDKLHVYPDLYSIADYKTAKNYYTEKKYTPAHREMVTWLVTDWQKQLIEDVAAGRKLEPAEVEALVRGGPYLAEEAAEHKLVDKVLYPDEYRELLKKKAATEELKTLDWNSYRQRSRAPSGPAIAIVHATGAIVTGKSGYQPFDGRYLGADTVAEALRQAREDDSVKAIVFRIDSPGGSALASELIRRQVVLAKKDKPVVVSMSDVAGSGGYWIAMSADKIVADTGTLTGSIGVVFGKLNVKGLYELLGMTNDYVALGPNATLLYVFENFTPQQRELVLKYMQMIYRNFLEGVSEGRGLTTEEVDRIGQGRVWLGRQAKDLKLVDEVGGLDTAVALAKKLAKIPAEQTVSFKIYPREKTAWEQFQEWLQIRAAPQPPLKVLLDPSRAVTAREPVQVRMPFRLELR